MLFATGPQGGISTKDETGDFNGITTNKILSPSQATAEGITRSGGIMVEDLNGDATPIGGFQMFNGDGGVLTLDSKGHTTPIKFGTTIAPQPFANVSTVKAGRTTINKWPKFMSNFPCIITHDFHWDTIGMTMVDDGFRVVVPEGDDGPFPIDWYGFGGTTDSFGSANPYPNPPGVPTFFKVVRSNAQYKVTTRPNPITPGPCTLNISYNGVAGLEVYTIIPVFPSDPCGVFPAHQAEAYDPSNKTLVWTSPDTGGATITYAVPIDPIPINSSVFLHVRITGDEAEIFYDGTTHYTEGIIRMGQFTPSSPCLVLRIDYD